MSIDDIRVDLAKHQHDGLSSPAQLEAELTAEINQLREALASRTITAQATGILAARFHLSTDRAWLLLRQTSNLSNRKLNNIARVVVHAHDNIPVTDEADQCVVVDLVTVLDKALLAVEAKPSQDMP